MDLSFIKLTPSQEAMVDKLAENAHNVWARDRIRQGWTYGIQQVSANFSHLERHLSIEIFHSKMRIMGIQKQEEAANECKSVGQRKQKYIIKAILLNLLVV